MTLDSKRIRDAITKAEKWLWQIRNQNHAWGDLPDRPSNAMDSAEAVYGLVVAGSNTQSMRMKESLAYIRNMKNLDIFAIRKASRNLAWPALMLMNAGEKSNSPALKFLVPLLASYKIKNEGWPMLKEGSSNVYDTCFAIRTIQTYDTLRKSDVHSKIIGNALKWIVSVRNRDGGWGFLDEEPSNVTCTAQAIITFGTTGLNKQLIPSAVKCLEAQTKRNEWEVTWEVEKLYHLGKYFHYNTPWVVSALLISGKKKSGLVTKGIEDILKRQASSGGWKILKRYNPFTHSTGNALMALAHYLDAGKS